MNKKEKFLTTSGRMAEMLSFQRFTATSEEEATIKGQALLLYGELGTADADLFISQELDALACYEIIARDIETGNIFKFICKDLADVNFV